MITHSNAYATDSQTKSSELSTAILSASSPPQIASACAQIESFLHKHPPDQSRWFFSITFPTLICKLFGFDVSPNGWLDIISTSNDSALASKLFTLLSPNSILMSSISAVDRLSLVKYVFPSERLPEYPRFLLQNERHSRLFEHLCPLFKNRVKQGNSFQVQLNVFEYYMFWFAYYPVCKGGSENCDGVSVRRSRRFRLENWAYSIPGFSNPKRGKEQKNECNIYVRLLYTYLSAFVPMHDMSAHQPYRSSLLHYSSVYDASVVENAEFFVYTLIHFWLVDNDFSPLPVSVCKSFGVTFPFLSVLGETPPTPGLGEVVNVFVKYLNLSAVGNTEGFDQVEPSGSPRWGVSGSVDVVKVIPPSVSSWNLVVQRPLYRFILRTFLFCPVETSIKNVSQVFSLWISYIEPWMITLEDFAELGANMDVSSNTTGKDGTQSPSHRYSSSWQGFVLTNYLFYSSLVMHFVGFAHKFLHTDAEVIVQMVSKVINILTSSRELIDLVKNVDTCFHSKPAGSSKSMLNSLHRFVPTIREQLKDWEDGLCESDADGSFLHENWNKDLRLFSDCEDGGKHLLQLFVLRAESELQAISGDNLSPNLQCLDSIKTRMGSLFGGPIEKPVSVVSQAIQCRQSRDEVFSPRMVSNCSVGDIKYKGDWMKRPISNDEVAWLAKLLVNLSGWLNESLGLNHGESSCVGSALSYVEVSGDLGNVYGATETMKVVFRFIGAWVATVCVAVANLMRKHGVRVNLRMLASKKVVMVFLVIAAFCVLKKVFCGVCNSV